ncbi:MAG TPA: DUF2635 domain-containing protein [Chloroflexota bacterium]|jgi:hypothetical protein
MFVKPAPGLLVRLHHARPRHLRPEGEEVPDTQDWHRAVVQGDVVLAEPAGETLVMHADPFVHTEPAAETPPSVEGDSA